MFLTRNPVPLHAAIAVPVPERTQSYVPVSNAALVNRIRTTFEKSTGMVLDKEQYGVTCKDQRFFGIHRYVNPGDDEGLHSLAVGFRNSYDKSVAVGLAVGANVFVCDNMCFSGDDFAVLRRHTTNVMRDLDELLIKAAGSALERYAKTSQELALLSEVEVDDRRAFELFGVALGNDVLSSSQINSAIRDWKAPRHEEFKAPNLWRWYNACNEALKSTPAHLMLSRHAGLHKMAMEELPVILQEQRPSRVVPTETIIDAEFTVVGEA